MVWVVSGEEKAPAGTSGRQPWLLFMVDVISGVEEVSPWELGVHYPRATLETPNRETGRNSNWVPGLMAGATWLLRLGEPLGGSWGNPAGPPPI